MLDLNEKVFGEITSKEIIGSEPSETEIENLLTKELAKLIKNLEEKTRRELNDEKTKQIKVEKLMNSRPGAMALSQEKIRIFTCFSKSYIKKIEERVD